MFACSMPTPTNGTDVLIDDWTEKLGWRIYDFLAERTTVNLWMMDEDAMLLTARGLTPQDVGLDLAVNRVPSPVLVYDDQGGYEERRPEPNPVQAPSPESHDIGCGR